MFDANAAERFWAKVRRGSDDECWPWQAGVDKDGYGRFRSMYVNHRSHRVAYQLANGDIPAGLCVLHACDNPKCCNPNHLSIGTNLDNIADRVAKGRSASGDRHFARLHPERMRRGSHINTSRLSDADVYDVLRRLKAGQSLSSIGRHYGVSHTAIRLIRDGRNWKHIPRNAEEVAA